MFLQQISMFLWTKLIVINHYVCWFLYICCHCVIVVSCIFSSIQSSVSCFKLLELLIYSCFFLLGNSFFFFFLLFFLFFFSFFLFSFSFLFLFSRFFLFTFSFFGNLFSAFTGTYDICLLFLKCYDIWQRSYSRCTIVLL